MPSRSARTAAEAKPAAVGGTLIFRATLPGSPSVYRDIEVEGRKSLYDLAAAIVRSFDFDFDHAFGFYSGTTRPTLMTALPKYELFADTGEPTEGALGVKRTKIASAFPRVGHVMTFLFDYGDDWLFKVELRAAGEKVSGQRYPRTVAKHGDAPEQYPALDDDGS
jgi:Plasmid pRiA4b ORF-3-like protein